MSQNINFSNESTVNLDSLLELLMGRITQFMEAERSTLFLYDPERQELWSRVVLGGENNDIRLKLDQGVAGYVMRTGEELNLEDAYRHPQFDPGFDQQSGYTTRSMLCQPLHNTHGERIGVIEVLNRNSGSFSAHHADLLRELASQAAISIENAQLYQHLKTMREAEQRLNHTLQQQHKQLQEAYLHIETSNTRLRRALRKIRITRLLSLLVVALVAASAYWFRPQELLDYLNQSLPGVTADSVDATKPAETVYTVTPQAVEATITAGGNIEPLDVLTVVNKVPGSVVERHFEYNDFVTKGKLLLVIDVRAEELNLRKKRAEYQEALESVNELENWTQSKDVIKAKRDVEQALYAVTSARRKLEDALRLAKLDIIPRSEIESLEAGLGSAEDVLASRREDHQSTLERGAKELRSAQLKLADAKYELDRQEEKIAAAQVYAPVSGVVLLPPGGNEGDEPLDVGRRVAEDDSLFSIANLEGLSIKTKVGETQVKKLALDQKVRISGDAFPDVQLQGKVSHVSFQADFGGGYRGSPQFDVAIAVDKLEETQQAQILLGMTAKLEVVVYAKQDALTVPFEAVNQEGETPSVQRLNPVTAKAEPVTIKTGVVEVERVEVLEGLREGDQVVYRANAS